MRLKLYCGTKTGLFCARLLIWAVGFETLILFQLRGLNTVNPCETSWQRWFIVKIHSSKPRWAPVSWNEASLAKRSWLRENEAGLKFLTHRRINLYIISVNTIRHTVSIFDYRSLTRRVFSPKGSLSESSLFRIFLGSVTRKRIVKFMNYFSLLKSSA